MTTKYRFQQVLDDGTKYGAYIGAQPNSIAKKMAREVYKNNEYTGKKSFDIIFLKFYNFFCYIIGTTLNG